MSDPEGRLQRLVEAIADYLRAHPGAADSEQGIADWWLPGLDASADEVLIAVRRLVAQGRMQTQSLPDGRRIHRAA